jgi:hypothetical protein
VLRAIALSTPLLAALASACGPAPAAPPAASAAGDADARRAAGAALTSLSRRSFDVHGCAASEARVVPEAQALAGAAPSDSCSILAARKLDRTWLVVVRSALSSKSYGAQARVTVTAGGEGVGAIEYAR